MKPIRSLDELSPLLMGQLKKGVVANAAFHTAGFESEIKAGTLFAESIPGGLILLRRREGFWRMSFYLQPEAELTALELPDQTVMEIPARPRDIALKQWETRWEARGFRLLFSRQRMALTQRSADAETGADRAVRSDFAAGSGCEVCDDRKAGSDCAPYFDYEVRLAVQSDRDEVRRLMEENYDRRTACLPMDDELAGDIASQSVWLAAYRGRVCGFLRLIREKRTVEVRQIAVSAEFRGRGIAGALLDQMYLGEGQRGHVWVAQNNAAALRLYESFGFVSDGWTSTVWLYEKG